MLSINYRFDTSRPSRGGMKFSFAETADAATKPVRGNGPVWNGITPPTTAIMDNSTDVLAFIDGLIGTTWAAWSLWYVMPSNGGSSYYKLLPAMLPNAVRKIDGHKAQLLCGRAESGEHYDARVDL